MSDGGSRKCQFSETELEVINTEFSIGFQCVLQPVFSDPTIHPFFCYQFGSIGGSWGTWGFTSNIKGFFGHTICLTVSLNACVAGSPVIFDFPRMNVSMETAMWRLYGYLYNSTIFFAISLTSIYLVIELSLSSSFLPPFMSWLISIQIPFLSLVCNQIYFFLTSSIAVGFLLSRAILLLF